MGLFLNLKFLFFAAFRIQRSHQRIPRFRPLGPLSSHICATRTLMLRPIWRPGHVGSFPGSRLRQAASVPCQMGDRESGLPGPAAPLSKPVNSTAQLLAKCQGSSGISPKKKHNILCRGRHATSPRPLLNQEGSLRTNSPSRLGLPAAGREGCTGGGATSDCRAITIISLTCDQH